MFWCTLVLEVTLKLTFIDFVLGLAIWQQAKTAWGEKKEVWTWGRIMRCKFSNISFKRERWQMDCPIIYQEKKKKKVFPIILVAVIFLLIDFLWFRLQTIANLQSSHVVSENNESLFSATSHNKLQTELTQYVIEYVIIMHRLGATHYSGRRLALMIDSFDHKCLDCEI